MTQIEQRRAFFPRGLFQPRKGFRFSVDSLLLSCFVPVKQGYTALDLGTGCAVVSLALFLNNPELQLKVTGVDICPEMLMAGKKNARLLALNGPFECLELNVRSFRQSNLVGPEAYDLVFTNPPYRGLGQGRRSPWENKNQACFESVACLEDFIQAGAYALKNKGSFCFVYLAEKVSHLFFLLSKYRLEPKRVRFVHGFKDREARLVLLEACKNGRPGLKVQAPLILYAQDEEGKHLTEEALEFCPFLGDRGQ